MKTINDLRNHLFETIEALKDKEKPMEIDRAKAIAGIAHEIIETAKAEVDMLRVTGTKVGSGFIPQPQVTGGAHPKLAGPAEEKSGAGYHRVGNPNP
jgi:hypothetical protein